MSEHLPPRMLPDRLEAGCDEAGRGCVAGPVVAAAVILPADFAHPLLNDSKQMSRALREKVEIIIKSEAIAWAYGIQSARNIEDLNILQASVKAMECAAQKLDPAPQHLLVDGPYFNRHSSIPYTCITGGDGKNASIAAASVLAKTLRDRLMESLHLFHPAYGWAQNKGYPTPIHKNAIRQHGPCIYHRRTYKTILELNQRKIWDV